MIKIIPSFALLDGGLLSPQRVTFRGISTNSLSFVFSGALATNTNEEISDSSISIRSKCDSLTSSSRNVVGDRSCLNNQLEGEIYLPFSIDCVAKPAVYKNCGVRSYPPFVSYSIESANLNDYFLACTSSDSISIGYRSPDSICYSDVAHLPDKRISYIIDYSGVPCFSDIYLSCDGRTATREKKPSYYTVPSQPITCEFISLRNMRRTNSTRRTLYAGRGFAFQYSWSDSEATCYLVVFAHSEFRSAAPTSTHTLRDESDISVTVAAYRGTKHLDAIDVPWTYLESRVKDLIKDASTIPELRSILLKNCKSFKRCVRNVAADYKSRLNGVACSQSNIPHQSIVEYLESDVFVKSLPLFRLDHVIDRSAQLRASPGEMALNAVNNCNVFSSNMIAYLRDIPSLLGEIDAAKDLLMDLDNPSKWASLWLSTRFGTKLTYEDTKELVASIKRALRTFMDELPKNFWFKSSSRDVRDVSVSIGQMQYDIRISDGFTFTYCDPDYKKLKSVGRHLIEFDVFPSLSNMWDLVPYSFVADWLVDFGGFFEQIDLIAQSSQYDVVATCLARRTQVSLSRRDCDDFYQNLFQNLLLSGECSETLFQKFVSANRLPLRYVRFSRTLGTRFPRFCPSLQIGHLSNKNIIDSASLILQRS